MCTLLSTTPAFADVLSLFGRVHTGMSFGGGLAGDVKDDDFFERTKGFTYGFLVGAQVLFIRAWIEHDRFTSFSDSKGTWTQFMLGGSFSAPLPVLEIGLTYGLGYGMGTGQHIDPANDGVSDRGLVVEAAPQLKYKFNTFLAAGLSVPVRFGFLWKDDAPAGASDKYTSLSVQGVLFLELTLGI